MNRAYRYTFHRSDLRCDFDARIAASTVLRPLAIKYDQKFRDMEADPSKHPQFSLWYLEFANAVDEWYMRWKREILESSR
jgi:hypothetical protein